jgi:hypothetical protein
MNTNPCTCEVPCPLQSGAHLGAAWHCRMQCDCIDCKEGLPINCSGKRVLKVEEIDGRTMEGCEALVNHENFSHTRMGDGCWREVVWIYHHDPKSPSGVSLVGSTSEAVLYSSRRPPGSAALSPREAR